ncbi:MAG: hypothetical protein COT74_01710 [Bdellovibrionales bacterium CG10_big_fil_rev_8_21_14_0_10_45_34]|nr:MAG: hypothetical protein COT74_01710 [Bdellovibrionales bacterium CG10_big_fil_rev_8_21_14_0_10_45_34]
MKRVTLKIKTAVLVSTLAILVGCPSKDNGAGAPPPPAATPTTPTVPTPTTPTDTNTAAKAGGEAVLQIDSITSFSEYAGRPLYNPKDVKVRVNLQNLGSWYGQDVYGGELAISYNDLGPGGRDQYYEGRFYSGTDLNENSHKRFAHGMFRGFFEDSLGAALIVIEETDDLGLMSGSVYYKNWNLAVCNSMPFFYPECNDKSQAKCWNILRGPYDCRTFVAQNSDGKWVVDIDKVTSSVPSDGYKRIGRFEGLNFAKAFNK